LNGNVANREIIRRGLRRRLTDDQTAPGFVAFMDNLRGIFLVLGLSRESESVLGLAIGNLVDPEPFIGGTDEAREMPLDIFDVVELGGQRVLDIDDDDFPVSLAFVEEGHDAENLDLLDLTNIADLLSDLTDIEGIVIAPRLRLGMRLAGVFPSLREGTIVPDVAVMGEAVANVSQPALLDILFDRVEGFLLGNFHFGVGPAGNLNDHVEDAIILVSEERDVMEGRDDGSILLNENTMLEGVG